MENEKQTTLARDLTTGPVSRTLIIFAIPMLLANLLQTIYNMVDMVVIGQFVGSTGLAAVSIGADIIHMPMFIAMGFCNAGQVIISQFVGAGNMKSVTRTIGTMFTVVLLGSLVLMGVCLIGSDTFLRLMNTPAEAYQLAREYCLTCYAGLFFTFGYSLVSAILRGMGDSRHPLIFIAIAAISNLILDIVFVAGFGWSAFGAALATVIGQAISFVASIIYLYRHKEAFGFDFKLRSFAVDGFVMRKLIKLGIPMCLQSVAINFSMMFVNAYINAYGVIAAAVTGIGAKLAIVTSVVSSSFSTSGGAMVGQSLGAGRTERVPKVIGFSMWVNLVFVSIFSAATVLLPREIFGLFNTDKEVLDMAMLYVPIAVLNNYGFALRAPFFSLINGVGNAKLNLAVGLLDGVVCRIGLALLLGITVGMEIRGFWYGNVLAGYAPFFIGGVYYISGKWKTQQLLISQ
ncbi:MAG: MATE family efflux transporter [Oscillospiraceae bacterium]|nr:MATE family efflux transporter [Oscillospiraceae bacterium]